MQPWQMTTVWAWEKTVVIVKQPGHLTSMKKERGAGTRVYSVIMLARANRRAHELVRQSEDGGKYKTFFFFHDDRKGGDDV